MILKSKVLLLLMSLCIFASTPETVSKSSTVPFSFLGTGVISGLSYKASNMAIAYKKSNIGAKTALISWALPTAIKSGTAKISVFTISGKLVKSYSIASQSGTVEFTQAYGKTAQGVYFATLAYGSFKKNIKMVF